MTIVEDINIMLEVKFTPELDDDADHWVCCIKEDLTLCGKDASGLDLDEDMEYPTCIPCSHLMVDLTYCPAGLVCPEE